MRLEHRRHEQHVGALPIGFDVEPLEGHAVYLMEITREGHDRSVVAPEGPVIRPARESEVDVAIHIDDDACTSFAELNAGFDDDLPDDHPFIVAEVTRWTEAARHGRLLFACTAAREAVGFCALDSVGRRPYLEQVSVRRTWMRRGIGRSLVERAQRWSIREGELWLTTYDGVPWNRPWYERLGFAAVAESNCDAEFRAILERERAALPRAAERIAMVYRHPRLTARR